MLFFQSHQINDVTVDALQVASSQVLFRLFWPCNRIDRRTRSLHLGIFADERSAIEEAVITDCTRPIKQHALGLFDLQVEVCLIQ